PQVSPNYLGALPSPPRASPNPLSPMSLRLQGVANRPFYAMSVACQPFSSSLVIGVALPSA
ncbi:unnamed protein product, partial [Ilex paraguariensis]